MLSDDRPLRFTMQQRRSTRKRGRPSHHGSPVKSTRSGAGIKIEDDAGGDAEAARPNKQQATSSRGRPFKPRASKRASMNTAATPAPAKSEPLQGAGGGHTEEEGPPAASLAGSVAVSAADTAAGGGAAASGAPASEPAASGAASVHAPDTAPEATSGCQAAEQWELLNRNADLLAIAPEDEIVAEIISLQSELAQVCIDKPSFVALEKLFVYYVEVRIGGTCDCYSLTWSGLPLGSAFSVCLSAPSTSASRLAPSLPLTSCPPNVFSKRRCCARCVALRHHTSLAHFAWSCYGAPLRCGSERPAVTNDTGVLSLTTPARH